MTDQLLLTDPEVLNLFAPLHENVRNLARRDGRPGYLAHYTSLDVLEKIIKNEELWFSHPFLMNDAQELRFGIEKGLEVFNAYSRDPEFLDACGDQQTAQMLVSMFGSCFFSFDLKHASDIYVLCLSEHNIVEKDSDGITINNEGLLSMWRAYGANGNGAALVFKTDFLTTKPQSPLFAGKVIYATDDQRKAWLLNMFRSGLRIVKTYSSVRVKIHLAAAAMFEVMKIYALLSKHKSFDEEREWRIIYLPDRDELNLLKESISYFHGPHGIEPKLKMKIEPLKFPERESWTFNDILHEIILGPSLASAQSRRAVALMLKENGKENFIGRTRVSTIPLRFGRQ